MPAPRPLQAVLGGTPKPSPRNLGEDRERNSQEHGHGTALAAGEPIYVDGSRNDGRDADDERSRPKSARHGKIGQSTLIPWLPPNGRASGARVAPT